MIKEMSVTDARNRLTSLELDVEDVVRVTKRSKPELAVLTWVMYEGLIETLEILSDEDLRLRIRKGLEDIDNNRLVDLEDLGIDLGLQS